MRRRGIVLCPYCGGKEVAHEERNSVVSTLWREGGGS